ncbi:MAG: hypothetical protein NVSMB7_09070 [Chitinophagaceae bacterium]
MESLLRLRELYRHKRTLNVIKLKVIVSCIYAKAIRSGLYKLERLVVIASVAQQSVLA